MNANTIVALVGGTGRNQIALTTGTSGDMTTATGLLLNTETVGTTLSATLSIPRQNRILGSSSPSSINANPAILGPAYGRLFGNPEGASTPYFTSGSFDGFPFRIRVSGVATMGAAAGQTLLVQLIHGGSALIGGAGNTIIASTGAALATAAGGAANFSIVAECLWDTTMLRIDGRRSSVIQFVTPSRQVTSDIVLTNRPACATYDLLQFQVFITAGDVAVSSAQVKEFAIEQI